MNTSLCLVFCPKYLSITLTYCVAILNVRFGLHQKQNQEGGLRVSRKFFYSEDKVALGLLIVRVGVGIAFMAHGFPKLFMGGALGLSKGLAAVGIPGGVIGAYLAGAAEFFGGMSLVAGLLFRPATVALAFNMLVALIFHFRHGDSFITYSHALESGILFLALMIAGPGRFSLDYKLFGSKAEKEVRSEKAGRPVGHVPAHQTS
jgi:putative oxidoreductase